MKTITQYREEIAAMMKTSGDLDGKAVVENRDLTEAEVEMKNDLMNKVSRIKSLIDTMEREENMRSMLEAPNKPKTNPKPEKATEHIEAGKDSRSKDKFRSFGEQLGAIMNASIPGRGIDPRLFTRATGLGESVPSDGGFMVQTDFSTELLKQVWQTGILAQRCRRITLSGNANSIKINGEDETSRATGSRAGGIRGYWAAEADEKTASKPKFRQIELKLNKLIGLCYATDELLEDVSALEGYIRQGFASEFGFLIDDGIINGTGAGQLLGILNAGSLVSVAKEVGQDADSVVC